MRSSRTLGPVPLLETTSRAVQLVLDSAAAGGELAPVAATLVHDGGNEIDANAEYRLNVAVLRHRSRYR